MRRALDLDSSPALTVPFRFFVNAPLFALLVAALLLYAGPQAFVSRWSPLALAVTHLITLGMLSSVMTGALIQILPVATGIHIARAQLSATIIHALLSSGTLLLACAFAFSAPMLFMVARLLLTIAFVWLIAACAVGFLRHRTKASRGTTDVLRAVKLALTSLLATVILGGMLVDALSGRSRFSIVTLTDLHLTWGLSGWVGLLMIGIAYQVIPMFQVTEPYPHHLARWLAPIVFAFLALLSSIIFLFPGQSPGTERLLGALLLAGYVAFAGVTLYLLWTRKRRVADATTLFWRTAMTSLACCAPLWATAILTRNDACFMTLGVLLLIGVAWSAVNGMLYKIIPFLLWYHLQASLTAPLHIVPKVKDVIPDRVAVKQFGAHLVSLLMLLAACVQPSLFARAAAIALGVSAIGLTLNMSNAIRLYLRVERQIASMGVGGPQA